MDWVIDLRTADTLLLQYSEWLDGEGLMKTRGVKDDRTHIGLVIEFVAQRHPDALPRVVVQ